MSNETSTRHNMGEPKFQSDDAPTRQGVLEDEELANGFMDDLQQMVEANHEQPQREAVWAEEVAPGVELARRGIALREVSPTIVALWRQLEQIRSAELERYRRKLGALEPVQRRAVEALTRGILSKILHDTVCELRAHAGTPEQHVVVQLVGRIFGLAQ